MPGVEPIRKGVMKDVLDAVKDRVQGATQGEFPKETSRVREKLSREDIKMTEARRFQRFLRGKVLH